MKRLILFLFIYCFPLLLIAQVEIIPKGRLEFMINKEGHQITPDTESNLILNPGIGNNVINLGTFRTDMGIEFLYKCISIHFDTEVYTRSNRELSFDPIQSNFIFKTQYQFKPKNIKVYFVHACYHPIKTNQININKYKLKGFYGGYSKIGISYNY